MPPSLLWVHLIFTLSWTNLGTYSWVSNKSPIHILLVPLNCVLTSALRDTVITDNGSNMVAAFRPEEEEEPSSADEDEGSSDGEHEEERYNLLWRLRLLSVFQVWRFIGANMLLCPHPTTGSHMIHKDASVERLLEKLKAIVKQFRRSSVATEKLHHSCGLALFTVPAVWQDGPALLKWFHVFFRWRILWPRLLMRWDGMGLSPPTWMDQDVKLSEICCCPLLTTQKHFRVTQCRCLWLCQP